MTNVSRFRVTRAMLDQAAGQEMAYRIFLNHLNTLVRQEKKPWTKVEVTLVIGE